jgi:DAK2 domain fusion protein YloV
MAAPEVSPPVPAVVLGRGLRRGLRSALARLSEQRDRINDLNVFPVPDGDTGTNMHLTLQAALAEAEGLGPDPNAGEVAAAVAHGALMGARGNSGVILSQILRGVAEGLRGKAEIGAEELAASLKEGSAAAYRAVKRPVEGTILSVVRDAAEAAATAAASGSSLAGVLQASATEAWDAVERSRSQLEVLRRAGVVDAGGFGAAVILTALAEEISGSGSLQDPEAAFPGRDGHGPGVLAVGAPDQGFGYCTEFSLVGSELGALEVRQRLGGEEDEDDSALVVGDPGLLHVHIHTAEPWQLLTRAAELGRIERLKVEDMTRQHQEARARVGSRPGAQVGARGVVVVAPGFGFHQLLLGLGAAAVVEGGQGRNPAIEELLRAIGEARCAEVLLLPNNPNLLLAAEQAARVSRSQVAVVPSRNLPQGIAALLAFDPEVGLEVNRKRMQRAMDGVHCIEVTTAVRPSQYPGGAIAQGDTIAVVDGEVAAAGAEAGEVVGAALQGLGGERLEVVTIYRGAGVEAAASSRLELAIKGRFPALEVESHDGGQALYPYIISAE